MNEEKILLQHAQNGDMEAFRELVEMNKKNVYYLALNLTGNHDMADDISQEVFIKLYRFLNKIRGDSKLSTWLYKVTLNTYSSFKRKKSSNLLTNYKNTDINESEEIQNLTDRSSANPEKNIERTELQKHIENALKKITDKERMVFVLRHYRNLSIKETSGIMGIAEGTVKSLLFRAVKKLQKELSFLNVKI